MAIISPYSSIITLNINVLNSPNQKTQSGSVNIKKKKKNTRSDDMLPMRLTLTFRTHIGKVKG